MHDLEIRGAGNILGAEQHGHVAAVGFELYTQMLEEAVNEQRGEPKAEALPEVTVDLALSTAVPDEYVPSRQRKLELYRRIAELRSLDDLSSLRDELRDRYGPPPDPRAQSPLRRRGEAAGCQRWRDRGTRARSRAAVGARSATSRSEQRVAVTRVFPKAQTGQRQIRLSVLDTRGDWRDALTRLLDLVAA
jgi:transcription-repair coupling factor (superfamily II helicase)